MESIVIGVDRTPASTAALAWVAARCARHAARVRIVNVVGRHGQDQTESMALLAEAERQVHERVPGQPVELHRAEGSIAQTLATLAEDADLLVIGIDPQHPIKAALGGWLPVRVASRFTAPVCIVPAGWTERDGDVVVGVADDESSIAALDFAAAEAQSSGATLRIVHAWRDADVTLDGPEALLSSAEQMATEHGQVLDDAAGRLRRDRPALSIEPVLIEATPEAALLGGAEDAALIVIGTHRQGVLQGGLSGSIAQDILWRTQVPVCVVPHLAPSPADETRP